MTPRLLKSIMDWFYWNLWKVIIICGCIGFILLMWYLVHLPDYRVIVIDHCEYIRSTSDGRLIHKGNCTNHVNQ